MIRKKTFITKLFIFSLLLIVFSCKENEAKNNVKPKQNSDHSVSNELLFNIEGLYKIENDSTNTEDCNLEIYITKKTKQYEYEFKSKERKLNGKVSLKLNENGDGYYITLEGIEWSEYEGNIDEVSKTENNPLDLPIGIEGSLFENQISIQNYGNSMNYYVQLYDCGKKYINLIKK